MSYALTYFDPQDGHPDDWISDKADASVVTYCIAQLAYHTGNDEAGDAAMGALDISCGQDDFSSDEVERVRDYLAANYCRPAQWLSAVTQEVKAVDDRKARADAKGAVVAFVRAVMA